MDREQAVAAAPALAVNAGQAVAAAPAIHNEGAGAGAGASARPVPECSTELKTLLDTLGYEQYVEPLARVGVYGMAELTATSKAELQKMGVLPGHANLLLQRARKPCDAQLAPKQPKATSAPKPAPKAMRFFVGWSVLHTHGNGATVRAKVVKNHGNGRYDIQFQQDGNDVVRLSVPTAKLRIA